MNSMSRDEALTWAAVIVSLVVLFAASLTGQAGVMFAAVATVAASVYVWDIVHTPARGKRRK